MRGTRWRRTIGTTLIKEGASLPRQSRTSRFPPRMFLEYARTGNRSHWEGVQFGRRTHLRHTVLAECAEGKGRFVDDIADGIWAICEESFWGVPAHMGAQKRGVGLPDVQEPIIELFSAETGALLAWTRYLFGKQIDKVHPLIRERLEAEIERRLLSVYRNRQDFGWMGLNNSAPVNNWNPWINSNLLTCALLMDARPGAARADGLQDPDQPGPVSGFVPRRWRLRRRSGLLESRRRIAVRMPRPAAFRKPWRGELFRPAAGPPDRRLHL